MPKKSAGILLYRRRKEQLEFFLVHPGGPFWKNKDAGAWTIPKGEFDDDEESLDAAKREFKEETGVTISGDFIELTPIKQKSGKWVYGWALECELDLDNMKSNSFEMEWPPRSGKMQSFPEIDKGAWFDEKTAMEKIIPAQGAFIVAVVEKEG